MSFLTQFRSTDADNGAKPAPVNEFEFGVAAIVVCGLTKGWTISGWGLYSTLFGISILVLYPIQPGCCAPF